MTTSENLLKNVQVSGLASRKQMRGTANDGDGWDGREGMSFTAHLKAVKQFPLQLCETLFPCRRKLLFSHGLSGWLSFTAQEAVSTTNCFWLGKKIFIPQAWLSALKMWKGQSAGGAFCLFSINNRRHELTAMQIPKAARNPGSSRNGNSLVVIAAEQDTWANYSVWEAELISPDAASHWHSSNPPGTSRAYCWLDIAACLQQLSELSTQCCALYKHSKEKEKKGRNQKYLSTKKAMKKSSQKPPENSEHWTATLLQERRVPESTVLQNNA